MILENYNDISYELQQKKMQLVKLAADRIIFGSSNKQELIINSCNFIKENGYDKEAFSMLQECLIKYNTKHLGKANGRMVELALADSTWMEVLMNPDQIDMFPSYQEVNDLYNIHPDKVRG